MIDPIGQKNNGFWNENWIPIENGFHLFHWKPGQGKPMVKKGNLVLRSILCDLCRSGRVHGSHSGLGVKGGDGKSDESAQNDQGQKKGDEKGAEGGMAHIFTSCPAAVRQKVRQKLTDFL